MQKNQSRQRFSSTALAGKEWMSSTSKKVMAGRAQEFLPELKVDCLVRPGVAGVRASVIDKKGDFAKEAIEIPGPLSFLIVNYNSPGATGSPAFAAWLIQKLSSNGYFEGLSRRPKFRSGTWDFDSVCKLVGG